MWTCRVERNGEGGGDPDPELGRGGDGGGGGGCSILTSTYSVSRKGLPGNKVVQYALYLNPETYRKETEKGVGVARAAKECENLLRFFLMHVRFGLKNKV
jgi:hypothetical protein